MISSTCMMMTTMMVMGMVMMLMTMKTTMIICQANIEILSAWTCLNGDAPESSTPLGRAPIPVRLFPFTSLTVPVSCQPTRVRFPTAHDVPVSRMLMQCCKPRQETNRMMMMIPQALSDRSRANAHFTVVARHGLFSRPPG